MLISRRRRERLMSGSHHLARTGGPAMCWHWHLPRGLPSCEASTARSKLDWLMEIGDVSGREERMPRKDSCRSSAVLHQGARQRGTTGGARTTALKLPKVGLKVGVHPRSLNVDGKGNLTNGHEWANVFKKLYII